MIYLALIGMQRRVYIVAPNLNLRSSQMGCQETLLAVSKEIRQILKLKQLQFSTASHLKENEHSLTRIKEKGQTLNNDSQFKNSYNKILDDIEESYEKELKLSSPNRPIIQMSKNSKKSAHGSS